MSSYPKDGANYAILPIIRLTFRSGYFVQVAVTLLLGQSHINGGPSCGFVDGIWHRKARRPHSKHLHNLDQHGDRQFLGTGVSGCQSRTAKLPQRHVRNKL